MIDLRSRDAWIVKRYTGIPSSPIIHHLNEYNQQGFLMDLPGGIVYDNRMLNLPENPANGVLTCRHLEKGANDEF